MKLGTGNNGEWTFLDIISIMSFCIGLQNLDMNSTQEDMQQVDYNSAIRADKILQEVHSHLEKQDKKIDLILEVLNNGSKRNLFKDSESYDKGNDDTRTDG